MSITTDGSCGLSWDDAIVTSMTPAPAARCPFEYFHEYDENDKPMPLDPEDIPADFIVRPV
jgi:hypothetical protein